MAIRSIWKDDGFRGFYRGFGVTALTFACQSAICWASYEQWRRFLYRNYPEHGLRNALLYNLSELGLIRHVPKSEIPVERSTLNISHSTCSVLCTHRTSRISSRVDHSCGEWNIGWWPRCDAHQPDRCRQDSFAGMACIEHTQSVTVCRLIDRLNPQPAGSSVL